MTTPRQSDYLRTSEVAERLHVSPATVRRWCTERRNGLRFIRTLGGHRRVLRADVEAIIAQAFTPDPAVLDEIIHADRPNQYR